MKNPLLHNPKLAWLDPQFVRPYVYVRKDNRCERPGSRYPLNWFPTTPLFKDPLQVDEVSFADLILRLETKAFEKSGMAMARWVFYDCAIMPGFVAGFAYKTANLPPEIRKIYDGIAGQEWTPISLFIIIPAMAPGEWIAHNLCSVNSLLAADQRFYGLGFLSKAFGLWHANIPVCVGMTQWKSPAIRLHSHYGLFEVLTAYTPVHSYARTLTYRCQIDPSYWLSFFQSAPSASFERNFMETAFSVDPSDDLSLKAFQRRIEAGEGPFFLSPDEIRNKPLGEPHHVYVRR